MTDEVKPDGYFTGLVKKYWGWGAAAVALLSHFGYTQPDKWVQTGDRIRVIAEQADTVIAQQPRAIVGDPATHPETASPDVDALVDRVVARLQLVLKPEAPTDGVPIEDRPQIILTGSDGVPIKDHKAEAGQLVMVTASQKVPVGWSVSKYGEVRLVTMPDNLGFTFSLQPGSFVEFFLTDASLKSVSMRVECNLAPQPPPHVDPVPTPPEPAPKPTPPPGPVAKTRVSLSVVHSATNITPETAIVLNSIDTWNEFTAKGNEWIIYEESDDTPEGKKAVKDAGNLDLPVLVIYDKTTGTKLAAVPLPTSRSKLQAVVSEYTGDTYTEGTGNGR